MGSSRISNSVSSASSSRSYMSARTRHRSCSSRHSDIKKPSRKMKIIIAIGIALPIIAAIIGVVAWAVSADTAFEHPVISQRRSDVNMNNQEEDIFQALEDRHDMEYSRHFPQPNDDLEKHDFSRLDNLEDHNQFDDAPNKDPLYIVHFVPSPSPKVESSTSVPNSVSSVSNDVLQKILSASKGAKPGTPQFVVFAPIPGEEDHKNEDGTLGIGSQGSFLNRQSSNAAIDYDYEDELRKYQELLDSTSNPPQKETSRVGKSKEETQAQTEVHKETSKFVIQNFTSGNVYQSHHHQSVSPNSNIPLQNDINQQQLLRQQGLAPQSVYPHPPQGYSQVHSQGYSQSPPQGHSQNIPQGYSQGHQQGYAQGNVQGVSPGYVQQPVQQAQTYDQYQQQYYPQQDKNYVNPQPQATDRSGQYEPVGIKLNFGGGGGRGLLGGNYSPLGIIGSILRPILPRPRVNLNGKVMFGVMLENGLKFGDDKEKVNYG